MPISRPCFLAVFSVFLGSSMGQETGSKRRGICAGVVRHMGEAPGAPTFLLRN